MAREVPLLMPKMSMTMESGELLGWLKAEGDTIAAGDPVAEVQTDKVDMEVEAPVSGVLVRIVAQPGSTLDVGAPIAFISSESDDLMEGLFDAAPDSGAGDAESTGAAATAPGAAAQSTAAKASEPVTPNSDVPPADRQNPPPAADADRSSENASAQATPVSRRGPIPAVPFARRRAAQLRVALDTVTATGANGVITVDDVEKAAAAVDSGAESASGKDRQPAAAEPTPAPAPAPAAAPTPAASDADPGFAAALAPRRKAIRTAIARTMTASAAVPQFAVFADLDLEAVNPLRNRTGWTTLLLRALSIGLRRHPHINAGWDESANAPAAEKDTVGVALAVDSAVGLLAPVIRDADRLSVQDLDATVRATVDRARTGRLSGADIQGATTTLSNLGGQGVPSFTSLLTPPQATALSVGAIALRPVMVGGGLAIRLGTTVGLTIDHRAVDGADGARLLADIQELFRNPDSLLR